ncbi:adenosylmethionine--8-amino-7-oxononanoate transaminase [Helicobacter enhydrae]|uniref:Adenosylmethionine-8-amino-7-oxononanoate aminotransferase n=1 Tax=Helicobacter enhydrae TaxID=222136 RepID=A0A1B1U6K6_9HELI|nr:adenosylmethionine--8-amino-7-oxononanoate transaminase [Helicobacter enhydrae]ANV98423.1 adenosylmethionine--8-amino-7-oxononanoate transaminase [Helicobacter enhydrae]
MLNNLSAQIQDLNYIWHPCTQHKDHEQLPPIPIASGKGVYLYDFNQKAYIDCISSWWVNLFGHSHPYINAKLAEQAQELEHTLLAGFSHKGIISYSKRLIELLGQGFDKCFYADNGSSAVEVALKMSFHRHQILNNQRPIFLTLENSYHGETIGALSLSNIPLYQQIYKPLLLQSLNTPIPSQMTSTQEALEKLENILKEKGHQICAFILEPLIQCAGGMHFYPKEYLQQACKLCKQYGIDIIFDEIAVGFGRTGTMFAFEQCNITPDFLCLSKGITAGYLPLSVVVTNNEVFQNFYAPYEEYKAFLHSHSYTGNALAIACANATLDIFESEQILQNNAKKHLFITELFGQLQCFACVSNFRSLGMVFAFELDLDIPRAGFVFYSLALQHGLILRPLGNTIYFMPPYIITQEEIIQVYEGICSVLSILENKQKGYI